ncbi:MAG: NUDIX domain-containing protein [Candidatus Lokiarchaeota archaeon]|nr:NUDIX domain-containing protein [Candidatus Lokiarchaeota archaeon]
MSEAAAIAIITKCINKTKHVLLIYRNTEPYKNYWALPGGKINFKEAAKDAVIREIREEVDLDFEPILYYTYYERIPDKNIDGDVYVYEGNAKGEPRLSKNEITKFGWFSIQNSTKMNLAFSHNEILNNYLKNKKRSFQK